MAFRFSADRHHMPTNGGILVGNNEMADNNFLFYGDNLDVLRKHVKDETVDLCYIDPPFNSKRNYNQIYNNIGTEDLAQAQAFIDMWEWDEMAIKGYDEIISNPQARFTPQTVDLIKGLRAVLKEGSLLAYLVSITLRVTEIQRVLKPTGSFYMHCDSTASHYLKLILDAIFCPPGGDYKNEIIWKRTSGHSDSGRFGRVHDSVFFYTKSDTYTWNQQYQPYTKEYVEQYYRYKDKDGRMFMSDNLSAAGLSGGGYEYEWNGIKRVWRCPPDTMQRLDDEGKIFYTGNGYPRLKRYLDESKGLAMQDVWADIEAIRSWHKEKMGYPTQKPLGLLERIIKTSSNEGDIVLDAYCGCGTTVDAAEKLKRKWIGIDITYQSISLVLKRLEESYGSKILDTIILDGVPKDINSAVELANKKDDKLRKEFEKWAVLTYTNNRAVINQKKGADAGIDGIAYFKVGKKDNAKIIFQVKSGGVKRADIATLRGDMEKNEATLGVLITLEEPTKPMLHDAKAAGQYKHEEMGKSYERISIVTIREMLEEGKRLEIPMSLEVLNAMQKAIQEEQLSLL